MKTNILLFVLIFALAQTRAQDYQISFAGTGGSTTVETVNVQNLTQGTSLTLNGTDILHLLGVVGINPIDANSENPLSIYPNPMTESSSIEFEATASDITTIELCDITGKQSVRTQTMLPCGRHTFAVSELNSGIYTLSIKSEAYFYTGKLVCKNIGKGSGKISYVSGNLKSTTQSILKNTQSLIPMQYNDGDQLLFTGFSDIYSTVIPLVPTQSQTVTFTFVACTDADGNNYPTVTIGTQLWMAKNINVGTRIDSTQEQTNNSIIEKYCYNDHKSNCDVYGGLYQWNEMMQYDTTPGVQGICPTGWHIPTDAEWTTLTTFLGGESVAGGKMKETGFTHWLSPNTGATNSSGFTALPGGYRWGPPYYSYDVLTEAGIFWSSSQAWSNGAWYRYVYWLGESVTRSDPNKVISLSVRCLQD